MSCEHKWKETQGITSTYKDCTECGMKWEDYEEFEAGGIVAGGGFATLNEHFKRVYSDVILYPAGKIDGSEGKPKTGTIYIGEDAAYMFDGEHWQKMSPYEEI